MHSNYFVPIFFVSVAVIVILIVIVAYACYIIAFKVHKRDDESIFYLPDKEQYKPYKEESRRMIENALKVPYESVCITSYDGLTLYGKCYETSKDAPWFIMFHGYRSFAERDFSGGMPFGLEHGYNVLLVDQRAHGKSGGRCLTFGIKERRDCLSWVEYVCSKAGKNVKIVLYGMSMGASTVLMASGLPLPENVAGIVADCGYSSPTAIIKKVIRDMKLPVFPVYALVRLGGIIFGGFDLKSASAVSSLEKCDIPVLFIHGEDDDFVPCDMVRENFSHCRSADKKLLTVPKAGHGMSYMVDKKTYLNTLLSFLDDILKK